MNPITSRKISFNGSPIELCLGDILILDSPIKAHNYRDISDIMPLAVLAVGFSNGQIYFTLMGLDSFEYSVSRHTKKGLVLLSRKGKEIKISNKHIARFFRMFDRRKSADNIDGLMLYLRMLATDSMHLRHSFGRKIGKRLINMVEWPDKSLIIWAKRHLHIPPNHVPRIDMLGDRRAMINAMIKLSTARAKAEPKKSARIPISLETEPVVKLGEFPRPEDVITYNADMSQQENTVIENIGEAPFKIGVVVNSTDERITTDETEERPAFYKNSSGRFLRRPDPIAKLRHNRGEFGDTELEANIDESLQHNEENDPSDPGEIR